MACVWRLTVLHLLLYAGQFCCNGQATQQASCDAVKNSFGPLGNALDDFTPGHASKCQLDQTCCSPELEDTLLLSSSDMYGRKVGNIILKSVETCFKDGGFEDSVARTIAAFEQPVIDIMQTTYREHFSKHRTIFHPFFTFLSQLPRTLDMCGVKNETMKMLFRIYRASTVEFSSQMALLYQPESYQTCLYNNYFLRHMSDDNDLFYKKLQKSLGRFWYFLRTRKIILDVINEMAEQKFGHSCMNALLRMNDCSKCAGHSTVTTCNSYCLNVARGCLVDLTELSNAYSALIARLQSLQNQINSVFNIDQLFVSLRSEFLQYTNAVSGKVSSASFIGEVKALCGEFQSVTPPPFSTGKRSVGMTESLVGLVETQMQCFENLDGVLKDIDQAVCTDTQTDTDCWNGNGLGSYDVLVYDKSRKAQQKNVELLVSKKTPYRYTKLKEALELANLDIAYLIGEEICNSDDEDLKCIASDDYCNILIPTFEFTPRPPGSNCNPMMSSGDFSGSGDGEFSGDMESSGCEEVPTDTTTPSEGTTQPPVVVETESRSETTPSIPPEWTARPTVPRVPVNSVTDNGASVARISLGLLSTLTAVLILAL